MKFTSHEEYGLRCLLQIGRHPGGLTIPEISRMEGLSEPYAAKLLRILRHAGYLKAARGQAGGYTLAKAAREIRIGEVLDELGGRLFETDFCQRHAGQEEACTHGSDCSIRWLWRTVQTAVDGVLGRLTLRDLLDTEENIKRNLSSLIHLGDGAPGTSAVSLAE